MPKITKIIISLFLILSFNSCVFLTENTLRNSVSENDFLNHFPENQKSIVIFKIKGKKKTKIYLCEEENVSDPRNCRSIYVSDQYHILMMRPANYYLFSSIKNKPLFQNNNDGHLKHFGVLQVKAGELTYAGKISYRQSSTIDKSGKKTIKQNFSVKDHSKLVKEIFSGNNIAQKSKLFSNQNWKINHLIKKYPSLENRFRINLLQKP
ncbi:MAG: hypothetical protein ACJA0S_001034 [Rickettsiales bacterium]|jgi:hypothetical protein